MENLESAARLLNKAGAKLEGARNDFFRTIPDYGLALYDAAQSIEFSLKAILLLHNESYPSNHHILYFYNKCKLFITLPDLSDKEQRLLHILQAEASKRRYDVEDTHEWEALQSLEMAAEYLHTSFEQFSSVPLTEFIKDILETSETIYNETVIMLHRHNPSTLS